MFSPAWFSPGPQEMLIVGVIALLLFGKRLPEVARNLGKGFVEFKKGIAGVEDEVRSSVRDVDRVASTPAARSTAVTNSSDDDFSAPRFDPPSA